ncbi:hypothetical protein M2459_001120 [Parabacteroides sp. PF5-5]|uniref:fimbrillin family protein n=1 Tax=unclassified Parabacteroides TaxID=2649774 RepID=UPI0024762CD5|nr:MULTISPECIES: fimbrillin family protein [unclassified Parabacteroides]MDH6304387.1 hypothetical protein [Parabacteroides sp. PH5-39]MDH6315460.1 hypothetical protein [Parabacteroides sp. PF5-13]MDH6319046.1 hypothetical protein [Parabacteroides sp. PH5-13]MDH6322776.1 hypothetical protein [Parabacteroides sp. PH5-8]MDH6326652.1 hypothetical protein [Parabacteroides sp. PH5-41]
MKTYNNISTPTLSPTPQPPKGGANISSCLNHSYLSYPPFRGLGGRRLRSLLSLLLLTLFLGSCGEGDPIENTHYGENEPRPLSGLSITRAGEDVGLGTLADGSMLTLFVKDALYTGENTEKRAMYDYSNNQWVTNSGSDRIRCSDGQYPAYAFGSVNLTYSNTAKDTICVHWVGSLQTTLSRDSAIAAPLAMQIATARIKVSLTGIYGEAPGTLPDFQINSNAQRAMEWSIPPNTDPFQVLHTAIPDIFSLTPHTASWLLSDNNGYSLGDIAPQTIAKGSHFLTLIAQGNDPLYGGNEYIVTAPNDILLEAGKEYHYTITLGGGKQASIVTQEITDFIPADNATVKTYRGISSEAELRQFSADWNADPVTALSKWEDAPGSGIIRLVNNITITDTKLFDPIGLTPNYFTAIFDGGGHTITGLKVENNDGYPIGLFSVTDGAIIRGVHLREAEIKGRHSTGGIVGWNGQNYSTTISACSFGGTVETSADNAGGIAGENAANSIISGCYSLATSITAAYPAYAIAGINLGSISGCHWLTGSPNQPAEATNNIGSATSSGCLSFDDEAKLQTDATYVNYMNNALYRLTGDKASPYSWLQVPGGNPPLMQVAPQLKLRKITTEAQLRQFSADWNTNSTAALAKWEDDYDSGIIRLGADIHMSPALFTPIGINFKFFTATFEGDGYTITGLKVNNSNDYGGFFGTVFYGVVRNLHLRGAEIKGTYAAGGIVGHNNEGTIIACSFGGTVESTAAEAAGIAGLNNTVTIGLVTIFGCYSIATKVQSATGKAYGIVGNNHANIDGCQWLTGNGLPTDVAYSGTATNCHSFTGVDNFYNNPAGNLVTFMNNAIEASGLSTYRWKEVTGDYPLLYKP